MNQPARVAGIETLNRTNAPSITPSLSACHFSRVVAARRAFGHFEELESSLPLAGNVTYSADPFGNATLTGDALHNNIRFEQSANFPGFYQLSGLNDATTNQPTLINGVNATIFIPIADAQSLTINLGDGNNQVLVKGVTMLNLRITAGTGNDRIDVGDYVPLTTPNAANNNQIISNNLIIRPGIGADTVRVNYVYSTANIIIQKTNDVDFQDFGSLDLAVYVAFTDELFVANNDDFLANTNPATSNDSISLGYVTTNTSLIVTTGDGSDLISYFACRDGVGQAGNIAMFDSGSGDDYVALDVNIYERGVKIEAGAGLDTIQFSRAVFLNSTTQVVRLTTGTVNDTLLVGKYFGLVGGQPVLLDSGSNIFGLVMNLGAGDDKATVVTNIINQFVLYMGAGNHEAYFGSNIGIEEGSIEGDASLIPGNTDTGKDRVRRFNNAMDVMSIFYTQISIESTVFGPQ